MSAARWYALLFAVVAVAAGTLALVAMRGGRDPLERPSPGPLGGDLLNALQIGLVPERNVFEQRKRHRPVCRYLSAQLDRPIRIRSLPHYRAVIEELAAGRLDAAFFGSYSYVLAHEQAGAAIIARPLWNDGVSQYRGLLLVRPELVGADLTDPRLGLALVSRATTAGYLFPKRYFARLGVTDLEEHFRRVFYAGSHDAAVWALAGGKADMAACKDLVYQHLLRGHPSLNQQMSIVETSEAVPSNGLAVAAHVSADLRARLKDLLLRMHEDPSGREALAAFEARRFIETTDADYRPVYEMARAAGESFGLPAGTAPSTRSGARP